MRARITALPKPRKGTATRARRAKKRASDRTLAVNAAKVRDRDGDRCRVCGSSDGVQVHHLVYRSRGGNHDTSNLVCLCMACHERVHAGTLRLSGNADADLVSLSGNLNVMAWFDERFGDTKMC